MLKALDELPAPIRARLDNVDVLVKEWPSRDDLAQGGLQDRHELFGLYEGIPLVDRGHYDMVLPDKITLFQRPIEAVCAARADVVREVRATVIHEVAHYFGISDEELDETDYG